MMIGIIEDDSLLNQALNKYLADNGYSTVSVHCKREALNMFVEDVDLFVIDIGLPDGNGISLYRELTAEKKIPAIFLTARDEEKDMIEAFETGPDLGT